MLTVPVVILVLSAALSAGVALALGGTSLLVLLTLAALLGGMAWLLFRGAAVEAAPPARLPGGAFGGIATVLAYRDVGSTMQDEPVLEATLRISVPGQEPYDVKMTDVVSVYASARITTDAAFRCLVDPGHPRDVVVHWEQPVALDGVADPQNRLGVATPVRTDASLSAAAVLANGLPGQARIVQSSSQGTTAPNGDPIMIFVLHVVPDNGTPPFQALTAQRVPPDRLHLTATGTLVEVAYEPDNRTRMVAVNWDATPVGGQEPTTVVPPVAVPGRRATA